MPSVVNERGELQSLYWGSRRAPGDTVPAAKADTGSASFDPSTGSTPQEYPAWGSALYTEPALKVSFPDGNRDLVLHYLSHTLDGSHVSVLLEGHLRDVRVELRYDIDPDSGILARSRASRTTRASPCSCSSRRRDMESAGGK